MISFLCAGCRRALQANDALAGKKIRCTGCDAVQRVPDQSPPDLAPAALPPPSYPWPGNYPVAAPLPPPAQAMIESSPPPTANIVVRMPDRRQHSPLAWGFGIGCGWMLAGLVAIMLPIGGCIALIGIGVYGRKTHDANPSSGSGGAKQQTWLDGAKGARLGPISVGVLEASIGEVTLAGSGDDFRSGERYLIVRLAIKNSDPAKKIAYDGWQGKDFELLGSTAARLEDEHGNRYRRIDFGFGADVKGQLKDEALYPGKQVEDVLVFELPVEAAKELRLTLPGKAIDQEGEIRLAIPRASVRGEK